MVIVNVTTRTLPGTFRVYYVSPLPPLTPRLARFPFAPRAIYAEADGDLFLPRAGKTSQQMFLSEPLDRLPPMHGQTYNLCSAIVAYSDHSFFPACGSFHFKPVFVCIFTVHTDENWLENERNHIQGRKNGPRLHLFPRDPEIPRKKVET